MAYRRLTCGGCPSRIIGALRNWHGHRNTARKHNLLMPMLLVIAAIMGCLPIEAITPVTAYADATTTATTDAYQLYDTRERTGQVSVNKVWDDGLTNDTRTLYSSNSYPYENWLSMTIQTGVPQTTLRTCTITYDANGGSFGTDTNGNAITLSGPSN